MFFPPLTFCFLLLSFFLSPTLRFSLSLPPSPPPLPALLPPSFILLFNPFGSLHVIFSLTLVCQLLFLSYPDVHCFGHIGDDLATAFLSLSNSKVAFLLLIPTPICGFGLNSQDNSNYSIGGWRLCQLLVPNPLVVWVGKVLANTISV